MRECRKRVLSETPKNFERMRWLRWAAFIVLLGVAACGGGSLYKVSPRVAAPLPERAGEARAGGILLRAVPLLTDEESQRLFEANLPLGGLLPVRVEITNESGAPLLLKRARFLLRDGEGQTWKMRSGKQAVARILEANEVTFYNPASRKEFEERVGAHALDVETPLNQSERREGLIFFQTPHKESVESPRGLVLVLEKIPQPFELRLN
jgi:hypothetical protein